MVWRRAIEEEVAVLRRIVALLFALAGLAESAAGRSPAVRALVIWLLRRAETVALDFVALEPDMAAALPVGPASTSPAEALRLAARLRALATQVDLLASLVVAGHRAAFSQSDPLPGAPMQAMRGILDGLSALVAFARPAPQFARAPDTS